MLRLSCSFGADIRQLHDLLHTTQLWNMAQPDSFQQNEMNQVQRVSTTNQGPGVVVGETVNSDPAAWIRNAGSGDAANRLSQQVAVRSLVYSLARLHALTSAEHGCAGLFPVRPGWLRGWRPVQGPIQWPVRPSVV